MLRSVSGAISVALLCTNDSYRASILAASIAGLGATVGRPGGAAGFDPSGPCAPSALLPGASQSEWKVLPLTPTICFYRRAKSINSTWMRAPDGSYSGTLIVKAFSRRLEKKTLSYLAINDPGRELPLPRYISMCGIQDFDSRIFPALACRQRLGSFPPYWRPNQYLVAL
jgi:hypothetical protein